MGRNPIVFFGKPKTVRNQTVSYRQLLKTKPGTNVHDTLYGYLYDCWTKTHPLFHLSFQEVTRRNQSIKNSKIFFGFYLFFFIATTIIIIFCVIKNESTGVTIFYLTSFLVLLFIMGVSLGCILFSKPWREFVKEVDKFVDTIVPLLWAMVEYRKKGHFTLAPVEEMNELLGFPTGEGIRGGIDGMLVTLTFKVRMLESEKPDGDLDLLEARQHFQLVHSTAVLFELAEKNPKTYYDRAKPVAPLADEPPPTA